MLGWPPGTFRDTGSGKRLNMTQVEIVGPVGGSRCMVTGSQAARAELARAERTAFRRFLAQLCPGCEWGRQTAR